MIRLNKYLASIGIASRRQIDTLISQGKFTVNEKTAQLGQQIDPQKDKIMFGQKLIENQVFELEYLILNKPRGYLSTTKDTHTRKTILDLVKTKNRLYPIGRLDKESQGLILLTNDGDLTNHLTHPKFHISKTYQVTVLGKVTDSQLNKLQSGIELEDGLTKPTKTRIIKIGNRETILEMVLYEGKKRQIRRMCSSLHLFILKLERVALGPIKLENLSLGKSRKLTAEEIKKLSNSHAQ